MNQVQKRLEIIKIAISMTDEETVKLQLLKLEYFENDNDLSEIIVLLKQKYYAKAQSLIIQYNSTPNNKFNDNQNEIKQDDPITTNNKSEESATKKDFIKLNPINKNSILKTINKNDTEKLSVENYGHTENNTTNDDSKTNKEMSIINNDDICIGKEDYLEYITKQQKELLEKASIDINSDNITQEKLVEVASVNSNIDDLTEKKYIPKKNTEYQTDGLTKETDSISYRKIANISTIFHSKASNHLSKPIMKVSKSASTWMKHIANGGYSDSEISKILTHINKLKSSSGKHAEAAQLVIICGSTESKLGQLIFARELVKGDSLNKDEEKALELIKELALSGYDEAICDYGQLIEHGIGTEADPKYAEELYKEAVNMDSDRGRRLYEAIRKKNHKFLSFFTG